MGFVYPYLIIKSNCCKSDFGEDAAIPYQNPTNELVAMWNLKHAMHWRKPPFRFPIPQRLGFQIALNRSGRSEGLSSHSQSNTCYIALNFCCPYLAAIGNISVGFPTAIFWVLSCRRVSFARHPIVYRDSAKALWECFDGEFWMIAEPGNIYFPAYRESLIGRLYLQCTACSPPRNISRHAHNEYGEISTDCL